MNSPANRRKTGQRKRTSWRPGQSGNPRGRPKKTPEQKEIEELARQLSTGAMERLGQIAMMGDDKDAVRACEAILDRGFGRSRQHLDVGLAVKSGIVYLPSEETDDGDPEQRSASARPTDEQVVEAQ